MRVLLAVPVALIAYILSVVVLLVFFYWFFDKPAEWDYFIPITASLVSIAIAGGTAKDMAKSGKVESMVMGIIALFWIAVVVADIVGFASDIIDTLSGKRVTMDDTDVFMFYLDHIMSFKIFAVVSCLCAFGGASNNT